MDEVARVPGLRRILERLGAALDPGRQADRAQLRAVLKTLQELRAEDGRRAEALAARLDAVDQATDAIRQDGTANRRTLERTRQGMTRQRDIVNRLLRRSGVDHGLQQLLALELGAGLTVELALQTLDLRSQRGGVAVARQHSVEPVEDPHGVSVASVAREGRVCPSGFADRRA